MISEQQTLVIDSPPALAIRQTCPACGAGSLDCFYKVDNVPVHSVLLMASRQEAVNYPRGSVHLAHCSGCGFIFNQTFNPSLMEYCSRYEETQGFSETFQKFHRALAKALDERHHLKNKLVIEIGCGKGEFLALLCETTGARGLGFDPSYIEGRAGAPQQGVQFIKDFYSERYAHPSGDLICCKMTLEHIDDVAKFVKVVASSMQPNAVAFFQVPDATRVFEDFAFWDVYYEHCSYFTAGSLSRLFRSAGLAPVYIGREYDGQYLTIDATPAASGLDPVDDRDRIAGYVNEFRSKIQKQLSAWRAFIRAATARPIVVFPAAGGPKTKTVGHEDLIFRTA